MLVITGASGQLGRLVIHELLQTQPAEKLVALVRDPAKARDLGDQGVVVRKADYTDPAALSTALKDATRVLLISSSEVGQRAVQHQNVIDAAKAAGVELLAYTSILRADVSPLALAAEHRQTEAALKASGLPCVLLRNGWYTENYTASAKGAIAQGGVAGCAGDGRIAAATRADYAAAAAKVLTSANQAGKVYELAGDSSFTLAELAAEYSRQSGKTLGYQNLSEAEFTALLVKVGLPEGFAAILADSETGASKGGLFDDGKQLSQLIGRPTTPLAEAVKAALDA